MPRWCGYYFRTAFSRLEPIDHNCSVVSTCIKLVSHHLFVFTRQGDADIFFPTDFRLLEQIDHHCSGFSKEQKNPGAFKPVKKRRTIIVSSHLLHASDALQAACAYWTNWCVGHRANSAWYCSLHGGVWPAAEDEDQRWVQSATRRFQEHKVLSQRPYTQRSYPQQEVVSFSCCVYSLVRSQDKTPTTLEPQPPLSIE